MSSVRREFPPHGYTPCSKVANNNNEGDNGDVEANMRKSMSGASSRPSEVDEPELLANNPQKRNWRGIVLALLVIAVISSIIITASILTTPREHIVYYGKPFTFSDIGHLNRNIKSLNYRIIKSHLIYLNEELDLVHLNLSTLEQRILLENIAIHEKLSFTGTYIPSPDISAVLLQYDSKPGNRHSQISKYDAVLLQRNEEKRQDVEKRVEVGRLPNSSEQAFLPFVQWSPLHNHLAFPYNHHVYIHLHPFDDVLSTILNVTSGMQDNGIQYGLSDWVYEEELLQTNVALWWNPVGSRLAFASFNETNVAANKIFRFDLGDELAGDVVLQNYPKAGDPSPNANPVISLYVYDLETSERREFPRPEAVPSDGLLLFVRWYDADHIIVCWTDRIQSEAWITVVSWPGNSSHVIYRTQAVNGWVDMIKETLNEPIVHPPSQSLFIILPKDYSEKRYRGIARLKVDLGGIDIQQTAKWLIAPEFDISDILHYDGRSAFVFSATGPDPKNAHIYWGSTERELFCITCENPNCTFSKGKVFENGRYFLHECRGPDVPSFSLRSINITVDRSGTRNVRSHHLITLLDNAEVKQKFYSRALPRTEFINLTLREGTRDQLVVEAKLLLPPELNKSHITKYPLLLQTYAGPSRQLVTTKFAIDWTTYLVATVKVVVLVVDGRGTGSRGRPFEHAVYKKLGVVEIEDQLDAVKTFVKTHRYVNETQVGAFGWSYGGFTVGHLLGHPENSLVRCGVMVAPVTDFKYYDTAYTERYMGRVADQPDAYLQTNIARLARNMRSKSLLLIHGTADDNVHLINSVSLTKALIKANVDVDVMVRPLINKSADLQSFSFHRIVRRVFSFGLNVGRHTTSGDVLRADFHFCKASMYACVL